MKIVDLTPDYFAAIAEGAVERYTACMPELFDHYFKFWSPDYKHINAYPAENIETGSRLIRAGLDTVVPKIGDLGLDVSGLELIIMVGNGASNGHAIKLEDRFCVWLPAETYQTQLRAEVFVAHELVHALHYTVCPAAWFNTSADKNDIIRQTLTEGIATFLSMTALGIDAGAALWADYLEESELQSWMRACRTQEPDMTMTLLTAAAGLPDANHDLFGTARPGDPTFFRGGYYLGLRCISALQAWHAWTPRELIHMPFHILKEHALSQLSKFL